MVQVRGAHFTGRAGGSHRFLISEKDDGAHKFGGIAIHEDDQPVGHSRFPPHDGRKFCNKVQNFLAGADVHDGAHRRDERGCGSTSAGADEPAAGSKTWGNDAVPWRFVALD